MFVDSGEGFETEGTSCTSRPREWPMGSSIASAVFHQHFVSSRRSSIGERGKRRRKDEKEGKGGEKKVKEKAYQVHAERKQPQSDYPVSPPQSH